MITADGRYDLTPFHVFVIILSSLMQRHRHYLWWAKRRGGPLWQTTSASDVCYDLKPATNYLSLFKCRDCSIATVRYRCCMFPCTAYPWQVVMLPSRTELGLCDFVCLSLGCCQPVDQFWWQVISHTHKFEDAENIGGWGERESGLMNLLVN